MRQNKLKLRRNIQGVKFWPDGTAARWGEIDGGRLMANMSCHNHPKVDVPASFCKKEQNFDFQKTNNKFGTKI